MERLLCLLIGYLFGMFLTAELVARCCTGKRAAAIGSGNPGMANIMQHVGFWPGAAVLAGDLAKTTAACLLCYALFPDLCRLSIYYAGIGVCLGHNFPVWNRFRGGKGVAVTCMFLFLYSPWGLLADIAGMLVVFFTGYLPFGAVCIPVVFLVPAFAIYGTECGFLTFFTVLLMLSRHWDGMIRAIHGQEPQSAKLFGRHKK